MGDGISCEPAKVQPLLVSLEIRIHSVPIDSFYQRHICFLMATQKVTTLGKHRGAYAHSYSTGLSAESGEKVHVKYTVHKGCYVLQRKTGNYYFCQLRMHVW